VQWSLQRDSLFTKEQASVGGGGKEASVPRLVKDKVEQIQSYGGVPEPLGVEKTGETPTFLGIVVFKGKTSACPEKEKKQGGGRRREKKKRHGRSDRQRTLLNFQPL